MSARDSDVDTLRPLECLFESMNDVAGHTEYGIRLAVPHLSSVHWTIQKRYNDFLALHDAVESYGMDVELPPKKSFGNKEREFLVERQRALQLYCTTLLENLFMVSSKPVKTFLLPGPRLATLTTSCVQLMAMVFRTDHRFELTGNLPGIGWRSNKEYAVVKNVDNPKQKLVGYWTSYGADRIPSSADITSFLQSFAQINHPLFYPLLFADARDTGCVCVRPENTTGSLLDVLCGSKYPQPFLKKYSRNKKSKAVTEEEIQRFGRQILEGLKFFHDNSIPYGNLSSRNVLVENGRVRITEIESGICGLRSFYWPYILQFRKISTFEAIDVYCFGHILYEMAFGRSLESATCDSISPACPPLVRAVLESILTTEACRFGMPTVSQLLTQPLFQSVVLNYEPASIKISRSLKDILMDSKSKMEARMAQEQKLFHAHRQELKVHSLQSSEDEKKKRRLVALKTQLSSGIVSDGDHERPSTPTGAAAVRPLSTDSVSMTSKAGPPVPGPPPPPPPPIKLEGAPPEVESKDRSALLASIRGFSKAQLSQTETNDKSAPKIS
ncbi:PX domain-containing protein kinase-like protein [Paramacrobiotus metropolitanus]|uniref:PX domain-containing protein kinase-like protein n=1 Tax=Paramacrobiotus metropolitanus TaxID=2943436 RepID=UPI002445CBDA|nr:PX domain-containing protein kinase-like protein [Paramacrobiotus metropolitanus]